MAIYCFKCPQCGTSFESIHREARHCNVPGLRDYRAEAVGIGSGVRVSRDGTRMDQARLFLPDNKDFAGPGDPDGTKGMRDWHEKFEPRSDNPSPVVPGRIERKTF